MSSFYPPNHASNPRHQDERHVDLRATLVAGLESHYRRDVPRTVSILTLAMASAVRQRLRVTPARRRDAR